MDVEWVKITSWHALRPYDHFGPTTFCGRDAADADEVKMTLPGGKSCETCLRIVARRQDDEKGAE